MDKFIVSDYTGIPAYWSDQAPKPPAVHRAWIITSPSKQYVAITSADAPKITDDFEPMYRWQAPDLEGFNHYGTVYVYSIADIHELEKRLKPNAVIYSYVNVPQFEDATWREFHDVRTFGS